MINAEKLKEIASERFTEYETVEYYGCDVVIRKILPFPVFRKIVSRVADSCFDSITGEYLPENREFATRLCIAELYTDVEIPDDIEQQYTLLFGTDFIQMVIGNINRDQFLDMQYAIDERIRVRNEANRAMFDRSVMDILNKIGEISDQISDVFSEVTQDDMKNLISAIGEGGIDEEKIVRAVVAEQNMMRDKNTDYMETEIKKENDIYGE